MSISTHIRSASVAVLAMLIAGLVGLGSAPALAGDHVSRADVHWLWDPATPIGNSKLVRSPNGISADYHSDWLYPGHAMTLWFIVFNNPAACANRPCQLGDFFNPDAMADFLVGGGVVTGQGRTTVGGHLGVGDASGSGFPEIGLPFLARGLTNPMGADVILALHSHGPKRRGQDLVAQIGSYTGGCDLFLGPDGFAAGPADVPVNDGECSTISLASHQGN